MVAAPPTRQAARGARRMRVSPCIGGRPDGEGHGAALGWDAGAHPGHRAWTSLAVGARAGPRAAESGTPVAEPRGRRASAPRADRRADGLLGLHAPHGGAPRRTRGPGLS